jgi:hypothetical protein
MANYLTMALDPNVATLYEFLVQMSPQLVLMISHLETELDALLVKHNFDIVDLYHKIAIGCDDFIGFCEIHRRFLSRSDRSGTPPNESCCGQLFNPTPFFSSSGTCFTTHGRVWEHFPYTFSSIKIWFNVREGNSPGKTYILVLDF